LLLNLQIELGGEKIEKIMNPTHCISYLRRKDDLDCHVPLKVITRMVGTGVNPSNYLFDAPCVLERTDEGMTQFSALLPYGDPEMKWYRPMAGERFMEGHVNVEVDIKAYSRAHFERDRPNQPIFDPPIEHRVESNGLATRFFMKTEYVDNVGYVANGEFCLANLYSTTRYAVFTLAVTLTVLLRDRTEVGCVGFTYFLKKMHSKTELRKRYAGDHPFLKLQNRIFEYDPDYYVH